MFPDNCKVLKEPAISKRLSEMYFNNRAGDPDLFCCENKIIRGQYFAVH